MGNVPGMDVLSGCVALSGIGGIWIAIPRALPGAGVESSPLGLEFYREGVSESNGPMEVVATAG